MCGICGRLQRDPGRPADTASVRRMSAELAHRGPDGDGVIADGPAALGSRRLAIVDRSAAGAQPMRADDAPVWIVHNGEIYGHAALRHELEQRGHRFRSRSDTEVILRLYLELGETCLERLDGMFAFAIWDGRRRELVAARDRYGEKPLYYRESPGGFAFASEIKALLAIAEAPPEADPAALHEFLSYDVVPAPSTAFLGIRALPPGHLLRWRDGDVGLRRWFRPCLATRRPAPPRAEAEREIRDRLRRAVLRRRADEVPYGVFLSGGVDSGALVALLTEAGGAPVRTFSVAFREASHDESRWSRRIARRFRTEHHEIVATPDLAAELPAILRHFDQPFGDPAALPTWYLARAARREITVALTGEGGDEAFAGYDRYRKNALAARWLRLPDVLRRAMAAPLAPLERSPLRFEHPLRQAARFAALAPASLDELYGRWRLHLDGGTRDALFTGDFARAAPGAPEERLMAELEATDGGDLLARELGADTLGYLPDDLLVKTDIATMAHGLEARCPFLDPELMDYAAGLPSEYKLRGLTGKWILKRALRGLLLRDVLRRSKRGFGLPLDGWLRVELRPLLHDLLLSRRSAERGLLRPEAVRALVTEHESGARSRAFELWNLLALELWFRERVDPPVQLRPRSV